MSDDQQYDSAPLPTEPVQADYFGFASEERFVFPDGISWISFNVMNEGKKSTFQKETQRDFVMERGTGNTRIKVDPSVERHALITSSATGWNLKRGNRENPFNLRELTDFLKVANPKLVEDLEKAIRKANPWMLSDMKSEDIQKEIDNLVEMLEVAKEREAGELASSNR